MSSSKEYIELEDQYGARHTQPMPIVLHRAKGVHVWDPEGRQYLDFLSCFGVVNQGHCHPQIKQAMLNQLDKGLTLSSRAFHNTKLGKFEQYLSQISGYQRVLTMNTGVEAVEAALKIARRWGCLHKHIPENKALIVCVRGNFHGRTITALSMSTDPICHDGFGPFTEGFMHISQEHASEELEALLNTLDGKNIAAFITENILGEAGIIVPPENYLSSIQKVCKAHNVLLICDEIQTGLGRTGKLFSYQHEPDVRPDMILLGKALSGGFLPVSAVLADDQVMLSLKPGQHGSTFGGSPLAAAVSYTALKVLIDEKMAENAAVQGALFRQGLELLQQKFPHIIKQVRGRGLMNAIEIFPLTDRSGKELCLILCKLGLLVKPSHGTSIRLCPPLIITTEQIQQALELLEKALTIFPTADLKSIF